MPEHWGWQIRLRIRVFTVLEPSHSAAHGSATAAAGYDPRVTPRCPAPQSDHSRLVSAYHHMLWAPYDPAAGGAASEEEAVALNEQQRAQFNSPGNPQLEQGPTSEGDSHSRLTGV
jgi:hypothetical protein